MPRFFVPPSAISDKAVIIEGDDVNHISRVLRMKESDKLTICDGNGNDYNCVIDKIEKKQVCCSILEKFENNAEPYCSITLFQGIPKGSKMDLIVQKCVEVGVCKIVPVQSERVVAKGEIKKERLSKISEEAAKQCGRGIIPEISKAVTFEEAINIMGKFELALMPYEEERNISIKSILKEKSPKTVAILIGPEGGFDEAEAEKAKNAGIPCVTIGKRILRTETAGMAVISNIIYEYEL